MTFFCVDWFSSINLCSANQPRYESTPTSWPLSSHRRTVFQSCLFFVVSTTLQRKDETVFTCCPLSCTLIGKSLHPWRIILHGRWCIIRASLAISWRRNRQWGWRCLSDDDRFWRFFFFMCWSSWQTLHSGHRFASSVWAMSSLCVSVWAVIKDGESGQQPPKNERPQKGNGRGWGSILCPCDGLTRGIATKKTTVP